MPRRKLSDGEKSKAAEMASAMTSRKRRPSVSSAMREVHTNIPRNVSETGKTGAAKEKMLRAVAFSKAGKNK